MQIQAKDDSKSFPKGLLQNSLYLKLNTCLRSLSPQEVYENSEYMNEKSEKAVESEAKTHKTALFKRLSGAWGQTAPFTA